MRIKTTLGNEEVRYGLELPKVDPKVIARHVFLLTGIVDKSLKVLVGVTAVFVEVGVEGSDFLLKLVKRSVVGGHTWHQSPGFCF